MKLIQILFKKELMDASRDKRSVMAGLYYAVFSPVLMCGLFMVLLKQFASTEELFITIEHAENAPNLVQYLDSKEIQHSNDETKVKPITLVISDDYGDNMSQGKPAMVTIVADKSDDKLRKSVSRLEAQLGRYNSEVASLRLITRGLSPTLMKAVDVQIQDQATPDSKGGMFLGLATLSIVLTLFYAAMNLAIDTSAGERERNSLALLLSHPINPLQIVLSKIFAISTFSMLGLVVILITSKFSYAMVPWEQLGFSVTLDLPFMLFAVVASIPLALMSASLQVFVSFMAKSFKEAQSYVTMVLFIPMMLSMVATYDIATETVQWLPVAAQQYAMIELIKGNAIPLPQLLLSSLVTLALFGVFTWLSSRLLKSERVVFGL